MVMVEVETSTEKMLSFKRMEYGLLSLGGITKRKSSSCCCSNVQVEVKTDRTEPSSMARETCPETTTADSVRKLLLRQSIFYYENRKYFKPTYYYPLEYSTV